MGYIAYLSNIGHNYDYSNFKKLNTSYLKEHCFKWLMCQQLRILIIATYMPLQIVALLFLIIFLPIHTHADIWTSPKIHFKFRVSDLNILNSKLYFFVNLKTSFRVQVLIQMSNYAGLTYTLGCLHSWLIHNVSLKLSKKMLNRFPYISLYQTLKQFWEGEGG